MNIRLRFLKEMNGPDSRRCIFGYKEVNFELIHDDFYGNSLRPLSENAELIVNEIGKDLESRFKMY